MKQILESFVGRSGGEIATEINTYLKKHSNYYVYTIAMSETFGFETALVCFNIEE